ncbi:hypothetical protein [Streptomyces chartreusis]|uniref:Uncharacterized protein n=1 Tax=Streptomyces chartreusis TaxID=1969 RepID=A0A7H8TEA6_STRCX|nr:hypothetical protein [Streptomyces chartreusis]QKZ20380.1 hypothetical protein HUT05_25335 [Streptomyces chartreusis]
MSPALNNREWQAFVSNALGLNVSEEGLLIDSDGQQDLTMWVPAEMPDPAPADL